MMVKIRLKRMGAKKKPFYRIVVADSRTQRDGRFIEEIGYYNPLTSPAEININSERAQHWVSEGAQPTETVRKLFTTSGALEKKEEVEETPEVIEEVLEAEEVVEESAE
ncbi:MAG: 30S ribosomal protein S16 [Anaerovoracaceae bacterium]